MEILQGPLNESPAVQKAERREAARRIAGMHHLFESASHNPLFRAVCWFLMFIKTNIEVGVPLEFSLENALHLHHIRLAQGSELLAPVWRPAPAFGITNAFPGESASVRVGKLWYPDTKPSSEMVSTIPHDWLSHECTLYLLANNLQSLAELSPVATVPARTALNPGGGLS